MTEENSFAYRSEQLFQQQLKEWPLVRDNYAALEEVSVREISLDGSIVILQHNPHRLQSSTAKLDSAKFAGRPCFLCGENQPLEQQSIDWGNGRYRIQINPYPIFPRHFTIASNEHVPQSVCDPRRIEDMLSLAHDFPDFVVFYNGPKCGASMPGHLHFQAGTKVLLPICTELASPLMWNEETILDSCNEGVISFNQRMGRFLFMIKATEPVITQLYFARLQVAIMEAMRLNDEPMQNLLCWYEDGEYYFIIVPRLKHRPSCYGNGNDQFLISPASVEMGGLWTVPLKGDFDRLDANLIQAIYDELCLDNASAVSIIDSFLYKS